MIKDFLKWTLIPGYGYKEIIDMTKECKNYTNDYIAGFTMAATSAECLKISIYCASFGFAYSMADKMFF